MIYSDYIWWYAMAFSNRHSSAEAPSFWFWTQESRELQESQEAKSDFIPDEFLFWEGVLSVLIDDHFQGWPAFCLVIWCHLCALIIDKIDNGTAVWSSDCFRCQASMKTSSHWLYSCTVAPSRFYRFTSAPEPRVSSSLKSALFWSTTTCISIQYGQYGRK